MRTTSLLLLSILSVASGLRRVVPSTPSEQKLVVPSTPSEQKLDEQGKPVFYIIVMGNLAYRHQVSLWVSSLRLVGGFKDEVVIVTDRPLCLSKTLAEAQMLGELISKNDNVDIYGPGKGMTGNIHLVKRPHTGNINKMKLEKARGWLNVQAAAIPHKVSSIIYTDEDVVIGKDVTEFVSTVRELEKAKYTLALFRDTGASAGELHTGVVVMFPGKHTDDCLQAWGKKLTGIRIGSAEEAAFKSLDQEVAETDIKEDTLLASEIKVMGPDQQALAKTGQCKRSPDHDGVKILPREFFWLPTASGLNKGMRRVFVHFTNTGRWKTISHTTIKTYLYKIGIPKNVEPTAKVQDKECANQAA